MTTLPPDSGTSTSPTLSGQESRGHQRSSPRRCEPCRFHSNQRARTTLWALTIGMKLADIALTTIRSKIETESHDSYYPLASDVHESLTTTWPHCHVLLCLPVRRYGSWFNDISDELWVSPVYQVGNFTLHESVHQVHQE